MINYIFQNSMKLLFPGIKKTNANTLEFHFNPSFFSLKVVKKPRFPGAKTLHCTLIGKGIKPVIPDDNMIQHCNIKKRTAVFDLFGDLDVGFAGCYGS